MKELEVQQLLQLAQEAREADLGVEVLCSGKADVVVYFMDQGPLEPWMLLRVQVGW